MRKLDKILYDEKEILQKPNNTLNKLLKETKNKRLFCNNQKILKSIHVVKY